MRTPGHAQPLQQLAVPRLVHPRPHRLRQHRTDFLRLLQLLDRCAHERVDRPECPRQHLSAPFADVADPQPVNEPPQLVALASLDLFDDLGGILLAEPPLDLPAVRAGRRARQVRQLLCVQA